MFSQKKHRNTQSYYEKFSTDFKNKYKKQNAWDAIAKTFSSTVESVEKRYKSIRTSYGRYLKKKKTLPTGTVRKEWLIIPEYEGLNWLNT